METVEFRGAVFTVWDVGGQDRIRALWRHYYANSNGIIFVVDASDKARLRKAREELVIMLKEPELANASLLVYANKQDQEQAMKAALIADGLGLYQLQNRRWHVQGACALTGDGLVEGLLWLYKSIK